MIWKIYDFEWLKAGDENEQQCYCFALFQWVPRKYNVGIVKVPKMLEMIHNSYTKWFIAEKFLYTKSLRNENKSKHFHRATTTQGWTICILVGVNRTRKRWQKKKIFMSI